MSDRSPLLLLGDILEAIENIESYTVGMTLEDFVKDKKTRDAVVRNFEIIGEAANKLPSDIMSLQPEIRWPEVIGFRHILIHHYFGVDYSIVWNILIQDLPPLRMAVSSLIDHLR